MSENKVTNLWRVALAALALVVPPAAIAVSYLLWRDELPARVASHWSDLGVADASVSTMGAFVLTLVLSGGAALVGFVFLALPRVGAGVQRGAMFWVGLVEGVSAGGWLVSAWVTLQAGSAAQAVLGPWIVVLFVSAFYGVLPYLLLPRPVLAIRRTPKALQLGGTETAALSRTVTANIFVWVTLLLVGISALVCVVLLANGQSGGIIFAVIMTLVAAVVAASFIRLRVTVDWRGLRVVSLFLRIPLKRISVAQVRAVESTQINPSEWGGWGYRFMPGRSALVLRGGPGLVVTTVRGTQFALTIDDPEPAAALLQGLANEK